jgi:hypothetical protein
MFVLKGFATHSAFTNNTPNQIHVIGELSQYSKSFSKDVGLYISSTLDNVQLNSFIAQEAGVNIKLSETDKTAIMTIITAVYNRSIAAGGAIYGDELENLLLANHADIGRNFQCGPIVNDGRYWVPAWIEWVLPSKESLVKVWFSNPAFEVEYDEFSITVVPPLVPLDDFFKHPTVVKNLIASRDHAETVEAIQAAKENKPESILRAEIFNYISPLVNTDRTPTNWTVLIYGPAGNNIDTIKDAMVDYVLKNSTHTREEWTKILPDLFKRTEFLVLPQYTQYAIENREIEAGIYSPIANLKTAMEWIKANAFNYPVAHIEMYADVFTHPYKSMSVCTIGSIENRDALFSIRQCFPDYIAVGTSSSDFDRMGADTRTWAEMISKMLIMADESNRYTTLPVGFGKLQRDGKWFVVKSFKNIHYLVAMKSNYEVTAGEVP